MSTRHESQQQRPPEKLDIEDDEQREKRLHAFFEKLNASGSQRAEIPPSFNFNGSKPHRINPPSELLSRVQAFLPQLEASNSLLAQRMQVDPKSVDIENVDDCMDQYIEMNLGLGVFEDKAHQRKESNNADADTSASPSLDSSGSSSANDSDWDSDSSSEIITSFQPLRRIIRPLPKRGTKKVQAEIIVLDDQAKSS